jgi:NADH-quinone oxidoreductase subunit L
MILVATGIGFLIHVYSIGYMAHEGGYYRFFGYLNLFIFFMLLLVLANNYVLLFAGWEGVGLCSYLLIGFYFNRKSANDAATKAFVVNRIGDAAFLVGMFLLWSVAGTLRFTEVTARLSQLSPEAAGLGVLSTIAVLFFFGAAGKSAQFPLYVWLPDAMEGPTPVSALIHAATMVTAGVYLVARSSALYRLTPEASLILAVIGAFTAILAASIALLQNDIKRVLAYSTVSQLGYMFLALGVGAYSAAVFHLFTHAFFKALLFLGAGSVIHALSGEQDLRKMGGLRKHLPITFAVMLVGTLAISGAPGLAGFFSKDQILHEAFLGSKWLYGVGLATAAMTAFYMWRLMFLAFFGEPRTAQHAHESPAVMTIPLGVLALGSVAAGYVNLDRWLGAEEAHHDSLALILGAVAVAAGVAGLLLAWRASRPIWEPQGGFARLLRNKWYMDEIYDAVFVNGLAKGGGRLLGRFDHRIVDGGVNGTSWLTRATSTFSIWWDTWIIDGAVRLSAFLVKLSSYPVRILQTGYLQSYALFFVIGAALFFGYYWIR